MRAEKFFDFLYAQTIDRSKFREIATRYLAFILPLFFWGTPPHPLGLVLLFMGILIRTWAAGTLQKDASLAATGPYLLVRHPLYLGSCLLALGLMIALRNPYVILIFGFITILTYRHTIEHEEKNLLSRFGDSFRQRQTETGALVPSWKALLQVLRSFFTQPKKLFMHFSWQQYMQNREYECLLGVLAILAFLFSPRFFNH